ncbi:MAG TPA: SIS domain-containing protein [Anaerolineaceae bacterium]|nr:SIS domain-containing protein [Anaerolineaceae bacterium]HPN53623.1 SIS domain-containing protein [Anaerolineaceae bacterium]
MEKKLLENNYVKDILAQPQALTDTLDGLDSLPLAPLQALAGRLGTASLRRVVLTGMGSSYHALHPANLALLQQGIESHMLETSELIHYAPRLLAPDTLLVAVSQSGRSAETVQLMDMAQGRLPLVGITNTLESPLGQRADLVIPTRAGSEFSVSCKTYVTALAALSYLSDALSGRNPAVTLGICREAVELMSGYLQHWEQYVDSLTGLLQGVRHLVLAGRGPSLAAAGTGGLIIKESAHFHAEGMSSAAFRHGPFEMLSAEMMVLVFAGIGPARQLNANLASDIHQAGGKAELISSSGSGSVFSLPLTAEVQLPLLEILPVQMVSLALAGLNQHDPGTFERGSKVTVVA